MDSILVQANKHYTRQCPLRRRGYDLEQIAERVAEICQVDVRELGISMTALARRIGMIRPGIVYAAQKGEAIAHENSYQLT